jgi:glycosyltransferase involved in cell wall biosynthesis
MTRTADEPTCLVYAPFSFSGRGPAESCASIIRHFDQDRLRTDAFVGRTRIRLADNVSTRQPLPPLVRSLPWRVVGERALASLDEAFRAAINEADPRSTVAYFWPDPPVELVRVARDRGLVTVREMINTACATSGPILDGAYGRLGLPARHGVTADRIAAESEELRTYDYLFASNPEVETSLRRLGIQNDRILPTSFGWNPSRFAESGRMPRPPRGVRVLFVGTLSVRKGVPDLLDAWRRAEVNGELILAGAVEPAIRDLLRRHTSNTSVRHLGYVKDLAALYRASDFFVFPTLEEGGPQVTYEAAGFGLPIVTTPMGAARLVESGQTGEVVQPGDVDHLATAIRRLARNDDLRSTYGEAAARRAKEFDYWHVGRRRRDQLLAVLDRR